MAKPNLKKLKEVADSLTAKEKTLSDKIRQDAIKAAARAGVHHPAEGEAEYEYKMRMHYDHVAHNSRIHPKADELHDLSKQALAARLLFKRTMRASQTTASDIINSLSLESSTKGHNSKNAFYTIEEHTDLIPHIIADQVVREAARHTNSNHLIKYTNRLVSKADKLFNSNPTFKKTIKSKGNKGRDHLYMFMRHWVSAHIKKDHPDLFHKLPHQFVNGVEVKSKASDAVDEGPDPKGTKQVDYDFKTIPHVNPKLPHAKPSKLEHYQANLNHLKKLHSNNKKQVEHHEFEHYYAEKFRDKILPKFHQMGYTANRKADIKTAAHAVTFHGDKLKHYTELSHKTSEQIAQHKGAIKALSNPKTQKIAAALQAVSVTAEFPLIKDVNFYKRMGKLYHLKIDRDTNDRISVLKASSNKTRAELYENAYKTHPLFSKLQKALKKASRLARYRAIASIQSTDAVNDNAQLYHNLMKEIYEEVENGLKSKNIKPTNDLMVKGILSHSKIDQLAALKTKENK